MKQTIKDSLEYFRQEAASNRDLGDKFERLVLSYLQKDPKYAELYSDVWLWSEWPLRAKKADTGILRNVPLPKLRGSYRSKGQLSRTLKGNH